MDARVHVHVLPVGRVALDCALLIGRGPATLAQSFLLPELHHWSHYPVKKIQTQYTKSFNWNWKIIKVENMKDFFNYYRSESTKLSFTYRQSSAHFCVFGKHSFYLIVKASSKSIQVKMNIL